MKYSNKEKKWKEDKKGRGEWSRIGGHKNKGKKGYESINEMMRKEDGTVQIRQGQPKLKKIIKLNQYCTFCVWALAIYKNFYLLTVMIGWFSAGVFWLKISPYSFLKRVVYVLKVFEKKLLISRRKGQMLHLIWFNIKGGNYYENIQSGNLLWQKVLGETHAVLLSS